VGDAVPRPHPQATHGRGTAHSDAARDASGMRGDLGTMTAGSDTAVGPDTVVEVAIAGIVVAVVGDTAEIVVAAAVAGTRAADFVVGCFRREKLGRAWR